MPVPGKMLLLFGSGGIISQDRFIRSRKLLHLFQSDSLLESTHKKAPSFLRANKLDCYSFVQQTMPNSFCALFEFFVFLNFLYPIHDRCMIAPTEQFAYLGE